MSPLSTAMLTPLATRLAGEIIDSVKKPFGNIAADVKVRLKAGFEQFFAKQISRYSQVRTILGSNTPLRMEDVYINLQIVNGLKSVYDDDLLTVLPNEKELLLPRPRGPANPC